MKRTEFKEAIDGLMCCKNGVHSLGEKLAAIAWALTTLLNHAAEHVDDIEAAKEAARPYMPWRVDSSCEAVDLSVFMNKAHGGYQPSDHVDILKVDMPTIHDTMDGGDE